MHTNITKALPLAILPLISLFAPAYGQMIEEYVVAPRVLQVVPAVPNTVTTTETTTVSKIRPVLKTVTTTHFLPAPNFKNRINDLTAWVDKGLATNTLTMAQAADFKHQLWALSDMEATLWNADGSYSAARTNDLDKSLTALNAAISKAMNDNAIAGRNATFQ